MDRSENNDRKGLSDIIRGLSNGFDRAWDFIGGVVSSKPGLLAGGSLSLTCGYLELNRLQKAAQIYLDKYQGVLDVEAFDNAYKYASSVGNELTTIGALAFGAYLIHKGLTKK